MSTTPSEFIGKAGALVLTALVVMIVFTFPVMWSWNYLAPLFGLPQLTLVQTYLLMFVCNVLFKGSLNIK